MPDYTSLALDFLPVIGAEPARATATPPSENAMDVTVIVCAKNEADRIGACLESVAAQGVGKIIVVLAESTDKTESIVVDMGFSYVPGTGQGLTADRQLGISKAGSAFICFVDADQRLGHQQIFRMLEEMIELKFDAINAGLSIEGSGWFSRAENSFLELTHNVPGPKRMIGVAPTIFRSGVFKMVAFDSHITSTIDDTDFSYRLKSTTEFRLGRSREVVTQEHRPGSRAYLRKFWWYGKGDGEFCVKHPHRSLSMGFHLLVRYPLIYPFRAVIAGDFRAGLYSIIQGFVRAMSALVRLTAPLLLTLFRPKMKGRNDTVSTM